MGLAAIIQGQGAVKFSVTKPESAYIRSVSSIITGAVGHIVCTQGPNSSCSLRMLWFQKPKKENKHKENSITCDRA